MPEEYQSFSPEDLLNKFKPVPKAEVIKIVTPEGNTVILNLKETLKGSADFYTNHHLSELAQALPQTIELTPEDRLRLEEALRANYTLGLVLPSPEVQQTITTDHLLALATEPLLGLPSDDPNQYTNPHIVKKDNQLIINHPNLELIDRPQGQSYLLLLEADPHNPNAPARVPAWTKDRTFPDLINLLENPNTRSKEIKQSMGESADLPLQGLTLPEYLILQRKFAEQFSDHRFDTCSDDSNQSQWSWLLSSRILDSQGAPTEVLNVCWGPRNRQIVLGWNGQMEMDRNMGLGVRSAVVIPIL